MSSRPRESDPGAPPPTEVGEDWWAMGELFSLAVDRVTAPIEGMHRAIAHRWLGLTGPSGEPVKRGYDSLTKAIYGSVRIGASVLGAVLPFGASWLGRRHTSPPLGSGLRATANALWGDELHLRNSRLAIDMGFRDSDGHRIDLIPESMAATLQGSDGMLVVLLHGLGETETCWQHRSAATPRLADILVAGSFTPIFLHYNTGRHVSDNGDELAKLLEKLAAVWPVRIDSIALVGHSMGGLVARSALAAGVAAGHAWATRTRHIVTLGTPHLGSPLEKGANLLAWGLDFTPESRPLGEFLRGRSVGIKDLRFGSTQDEDWAEVDPDALLSDAVEDVAPPRGVAQHFVAGVVTHDAAHPIGTLVGDLVVRVGSATGKGRRRRVDATDVLVLGRQRHFDLPTDPSVHEQIREWLNS